MNRHGQVVGECRWPDPDGPSVPHATVWQRVDGQWQSAYIGKLLARGHLSEAAGSEALRITDSGHILLYAAPKDRFSWPRAMVLAPVAP